MDSLVAHPDGVKCEQDPHNVGLHSVEGEEEQHEKKSVLKKVKAKAKKIKDTITKHGHGHNHDYGHDHHDVDHVPDDHDLDEEEDEDQEFVEDPDVHGAPIYESGAIRSCVPGQAESLGVSFESTTAMHVGPPAPTKRNEAKETDPIRANDHGPGLHRVNLETTTGLEEDPDAPKDNPDAYSGSNYQTKVADPSGAGGQEVGITGILHSLDKMNICDKPETKAKTGPEQSLSRTELEGHDQFSPEPVPPKPITIPGNHNSYPDTFDGTKDQDQPSNNIVHKPSDESSYLTKISSATYVIADKAISTKNIVASKLGYGVKDNITADQSHEGGENAKSASPVEYGKQIAATVAGKLTPVYEKVVGSGSKEHVTSTGCTGTEHEGGVKGQDKGVSVKDYLADKLRPGEEDRALSEVIWDALHKRKEDLGKVSSNRPKGKVTESEEVARRLGTEDHQGTGESVDSSFVDNPHEGMVNKVKGALGSWFGKGEESHAPQESLGPSHGAT